jgi:hypothetical protein
MVHLELSGLTVTVLIFYILLDGFGCQKLETTDICQHVSSCKITSRSCQCDELCTKYNDCCHDSAYVDMVEWNVNSLPENDPERYKSCKRIGDWHFEAMVTSCPKPIGTTRPFPEPIGTTRPFPDPDNTESNSSARDAEIACKCSRGETCDIGSDPFVDIPVYSDLRAIHYQNAYCAMCHNVAAYEYRYWDILVTAPCYPLLTVNTARRARYDETINSIMKTQTNSSSLSCGFVLKRPKGSLAGRPCYSYAISTCPEDYGSTERERYMKDKCLTHGFSPLRVDQYVVYFNMFCAYCNDEDSVSYPNDIVIVSLRIHGRGPCRLYATRSVRVIISPRSEISDVNTCFMISPRYIRESKLCTVPTARDPKTL